jgi:hypothetical protein
MITVKDSLYIECKYNGATVDKYGDDDDDDENGSIQLISSCAPQQTRPITVRHKNNSTREKI